MMKGFTLAEVLITLAIISVVAAMTIPTLIQSYQEKVTVTKLKKIYSVISQAYQMAEQEYGDPTNWDLIAESSGEGAVNMVEKFKPYLKIIKEEISTTWYCLYLADGSNITFTVRNPDCASMRGTGALAQSCAIIEPGLNTKTRTDGVNHFQFVLTKSGIVPTGTPETTVNPFSRCKPGMTGLQGLGCTAWVIYNENMDYLRCNDLSWNGKTKCD